MRRLVRSGEPGHFLQGPPIGEPILVRCGDFRARSSICREMTAESPFSASEGNEVHNRPVRCAEPVLAQGWIALQGQTLAQRRAAAWVVREHAN